MPRTLLAVFGTGCLLLSGCGTFSDAMCGPLDDHVYYRGVRHDIAAVKEGGPMTLMAADIPFSAVADTFLIRYYARVHRESDANRRARSEQVTSPPPNADAIRSAGSREPE